MKTTIIFATAALTLAISSALAASSDPPSATAVVNSDGTLARSVHATSSQRLSKGAYLVDFDRDVTACSYTATIGLSGTTDVSDPGIVTVVGRTNDANGVYVQTFTPKGKPTTLGFHMTVQC